MSIQSVDGIAAGERARLDMDCEAPRGDGLRCQRLDGHSGPHRAFQGEAPIEWTGPMVAPNVAPRDMTTDQLAAELQAFAPPPAPAAVACVCGEAACPCDGTCYECAAAPAVAPAPAWDDAPGHTRESAQEAPATVAPAPAPVAIAPYALGWFPMQARFGGTCPACRAGIRKGDSIGYSRESREARHDQCVPRATVAPAPATRPDFAATVQQAIERSRPVGVPQGPISIMDMIAPSPAPVAPLARPLTPRVVPAGYVEIPRPAMLPARCGRLLDAEARHALIWEELAREESRDGAE
jgi:hypothetical protein